MEIEKVRNEISTKQEALEGNDDYQLLLAQLDLKQDYFSHTLSTIGKSNEKVDTKVIKSICKETYVKDSIDED